MKHDPFRCDLVDHILAKQSELEDWFAKQNKLAPAPPYTSIDLRDSGCKVSPVDSNMFPAGFNNICPEDWGLAAATFGRVLSAQGKPEKILLIPENHTNNGFYFNNLWALRELLVLAGFEVVIGHLNPELKPNLPQGATSVTAQNGRTVVLEKIHREGALLQTERVRFTKNDLVLLNNDLSGGIPPELNGLEQNVVPHPSMGWHRRRKSEHLRHYTDLAREFSLLIGVDPWCITPRYSKVENLDFDNGVGIDRLAEATDQLISDLRKDYEGRCVKHEPFVFIKHDAGTYGRSIMSVKGGREVLEMNRRDKNKMNVGKGGVQVSSVVLMEGIPTGMREDDQTAEPVIYLAGSDPIGGFLRLNPNRDETGNLNSPGAHFKTLCFANLVRGASPEAVLLERLYGTLGRLSALANGREMQ